MSILLGLFITVFHLKPARLGPNIEFALVMTCVVIGNFKSSLLPYPCIHSIWGVPPLIAAHVPVFPFPTLAGYIIQPNSLLSERPLLQAMTFLVTHRAPLIILHSCAWS